MNYIDPQHVTCRRNIIDGVGNWTIDKMCNSCQNELFMKMMIQAEIKQFPNVKDALLRTVARIEK